MADQDELDVPTLTDLAQLGSRATITRAEITNYRSIEYANLSLGNVTVLVGGNGVGKSNVVDVFRFVSEGLTLGLFTALERRGGIQSVRHRVPGGRRGRRVQIAIQMQFDKGFQGRYSFTIVSQEGGAYHVAEEECGIFTDAGFQAVCAKFRDGEFQDDSYIRARDFDSLGGAELADLFFGRASTGNPELLGLPLIGSAPGLNAILRSLRALRVYAIAPDLLREPQDPDEGRVLSPDGRNASSVWRSLSRRRRSELTDLLGYAVPGTDEIRAIRQGRKRGLEFTQRSDEGGLRFEGHQMSDGTLRLFGILLALLQPARATLIAIEEPEVSIHVAALEALVAVVRAESETGQIVLTTHSADLLDFVEPSEVRLVRTEGGKTVVADVAKHSMDAVRESLFGLGELHRMSGLRPAD